MRRRLLLVVPVVLLCGLVAVGVDGSSAGEPGGHQADLPAAAQVSPGVPAGSSTGDAYALQQRDTPSATAAGETAPDVPIAACPAAPHPCGEVWPAGLDGPFGLQEVRRVQVTSHDGVVLDGWLGFPDLPPGVQAPVILTSTPYLSNCMVHPAFGPSCYTNPETDGWWSDAPTEGGAQAAVGVSPIHWIREGYVLASFSLRGTGQSGGCQDTGGRAEQLDQALLVDWLAAQPWSNGRVGMAGFSYPGWTTWQAAVHAPAGLKAIVSVAPITDYYEYLFSPQGAWSTANIVVASTWLGQYGSPPVNDPSGGALTPMAARAGCPPERNPLLFDATTYLTGQRDAAFFEERDLGPRLGDVRAAVLHTQGYSDFSHWFQDRDVAAQLPVGTPVREIRGWWFHNFPDGTRPFVPPSDSGETGWADIVTRWFDYWLKGEGPVPRLGVDHLDQDGGWHRSVSWPPPEARLEERPLEDADLVLAPALVETVELGIVAASVAGTNLIGGGGSMCTETPAGLPTPSAVFEWPASTDLVVAGNPSLDLTVTSSLPSGVLNATLYDVGPGFRCPAAPSTDVVWLTGGAADLEHHASRYDAVPFPVGVPTRLHIDLADVTASIRAGHRLALVLSDGDLLHVPDPGSAVGRVSIDGETSRLVLPVVEG